MTDATDTLQDRASTTKKKVVSKLNALKKNVEDYVSHVDVNGLKASLNSHVKNAQKDFNRIVNKDLEVLKKKLQKEKLDVEKKAKKFLDGHKKELNALQTRFEKLLKASTKLKAKAPVKARATKKVAKKAAKKVTKKTVAAV